jgi:hypothetical protein
MNAPNGNGSVPPFITEAETERQRATLRHGRTNTIVMAIGWLGLTIAIIGGGKLLWGYLIYGSIPQGNDLWAQGIMLALTYLVGWAVSLVSIRKLNNIILPIVIRFYEIFVVIGMLLIYGRAVYKLFLELEMNIDRYSIVLATTFIILVSLSLLAEDHDLRPLAIPFGLAGVVHLFVAVFHYVFWGAEKPEFVNGDLFFIGIIVVIILLMLPRWLYWPFRGMIEQIFPSEIG